MSLLARAVDLVGDEPLNILPRLNYQSTLTASSSSSSVPSSAGPSHRDSTTGTSAVTHICSCGYSRSGRSALIYSTTTVHLHSHSNTSHRLLDSLQDQQQPLLAPLRDQLRVSLPDPSHYKPRRIAGGQLKINVCMPDACRPSENDSLLAIDR